MAPRVRRTGRSTMLETNTGKGCKRQRQAVFLNLMMLVTLIPSSLCAWEREGHEIVAMLAEQRLRPDVRKEVNALLEGTSFADASTWADKERTQDTAPWHYVNIPITETQ